jgi:peptidoglycan L-alanyl-D-glutamate endopeptidase CwlK
MGKYKLGARSQGNLEGVHPKLRMVVERAIEITEQDFLVIEGVRSELQCQINYGKGRTIAQCKAVGVPSQYAKPKEAKVTWTLNSNHKKNKATGWGHAVDITPFPVDWSKTAKFDAIAKAMFKAAEELKVPIRWGADWDRDGKPRERGESDSPHFELAL